MALAESVVMLSGCNNSVTELTKIINKAGHTHFVHRARLSRNRRLAFWICLSSPARFASTWDKSSDVPTPPAEFRSNRKRQASTMVQSFVHGYNVHTAMSWGEANHASATAKLPSGRVGIATIPTKEQYATKLHQSVHDLLTSMQVTYSISTCPFSK